jgi:hypothetical protein
MSRSIIERIQIAVEGGEIPAKIYHEARRNVSFSIARKGAYLRMPLLLPPGERRKHLEAFEHWVKRQFVQRSTLQAQFFGKTYSSGDRIVVGKKIYELIIEFTDRKSHAARLQKNVIHLSLTSADSEMRRQKATKHLLSRVIAKDFLPAIENRVHEINKLYFQKPIASINLKYNLSRWGSCSARNNINLSTRLLFAPDDVIDYVIIHELAHLVEMNHSPRFWSLVETAMPDYREKEKWLNENWRLCDF